MTGIADMGMAGAVGMAGVADMAEVTIMVAGMAADMVMGEGIITTKPTFLFQA